MPNCVGDGFAGTGASPVDGTIPAIVGDDDIPLSLAPPAVSAPTVGTRFTSGAAYCTAGPGVIPGEPLLEFVSVPEPLDVVTL